MKYIGDIVEINLELVKIDTQRNIVDGVVYTEEVTALTFETDVNNVTYQYCIALCNAWTYDNSSWQGIGNTISRKIEEFKKKLEMK